MKGLQAIAAVNPTRFSCGQSVCVSGYLAGSATSTAELAGGEEAQAIQLELEYAPAPPFNAGRPDVAPQAIVELVKQRSEQGLAVRRRIVMEIAADRT
ncbi:protein of unknown function [Burkholderia multivorans]